MGDAGPGPGAAAIAFISHRIPARSPAATPRSSVSSTRSLWSVLARWSGDQILATPAPAFFYNLQLHSH